MSGGNDPLVVEDWSAYEKSMLDVLREERRTRLKVVPVERPLTPEELRQFVQGKAIEPVFDEPSISNAAPRLTSILPLEAQDEPVLRSSTMDDHVPGNDPAPEQVSSTSEEHQAERVASPAVAEVLRDYQPADALPVAAVQPARRAALHWRVPLLVSALILSVTAGAITIVKRGSGINRTPEVVVSQVARIQEDSNAVVSQQASVGKDTTAAVNTIPAPISDPGKSETEAPVTDKREVSGDRVRMRGGPAVDAPVLMVLGRGAAVTIKAQSTQDDWCRVQASDGREGWMKCGFLRAPDRIERQAR